MFLLLIGTFISYNFDFKQICFIIISYWRTITHVNSIIDENNCDKLLKYIIKNSKYIQSNSININEKIPIGLCFNKKFIAFIKNEIISGQRDSKVEYFITFIGILPEEIKINHSIDLKETKKKDTIEIMMRQESRYCSKFVPRTLKFNFKPNKKQDIIINSIMDHYNNTSNINKVGKYLIQGDSGTGKSFISKLLANIMNCPLTFQIKLDQPGNTISAVYSTLNNHDEKDKPLIVLLDEWDIIIKNIHCGDKYKQHDWLITEVYNKETYNTFLSETTQMFPNVIYIMTMNCSVNDINKLDTSYLRTGRIDKTFKL